MFAIILLGLFQVKTPAFPQNDLDQRMQAAAMLFEQGKTTESKKTFEALLAELRNRPPSSELGFVLNGLSKIAASDGDYKGAVQFAKQSANTYHQVRDDGGESHSLNNQGIAEMQMGQYQAAQQSLKSALLLSQRAQDAENEVQVLNNLGSAYYFPGSYSEAMHRYDDAMILVEQQGSAKWSDYWRQITSFNQATLFQRLGRYEQALQIYRQVNQSAKDLTAGDRGHLYANLGALYRRLGDPYKALEAYREAQRLYSDQHDAAGELTVLKNIGIVYALDMDDLPQAQKIFGSAIVFAQNAHNRREEMQAHLYLGETLFRAGNSPQAKGEFARSYSLASDLGTSEEQWKSLYGLGRIAEQGGDLVAAEQDYRQAIVIIEKTRSQLHLAALRSDFFADKRDAYDALIALLFESKHNLAEIFSFLEKSRARNFQDRFQGQRGDSSADPATFEQSCTALRPETALLEYWTSDDHVGVLWCTLKASGMMFRTVSTQQMRQISDVLQGMPDNLGGDWRARFHPLDTLLPQDSALFQELHHLVIVPDGWVSYVPLELLSPDNSDSTLIERCDISYLPTAALLHRPRSPQRFPRLPWSTELVAFGDPTIQTQQITGTVGEVEGQNMQPLPFSGQEILNIAGFTRGRSKLFLRQNDLKKSFRATNVNRASLLHVSTHAFTDANSPENSRLLFSSESPQGDPDYVFLRELYDLDLSNVRLATISACDTERGKIVRGEGVQAFSRALLSAGADSSLTTLWRVDDELTSEFMRQFYYLLIHEHMPKAEALRLTKLKFMHANAKLAAPQLWAAFVLNGDGATSLPFVLSWTELVLLSVGFFGAVTAAVILISLWRRRRINREHGSCAVVS